MKLTRRQILLSGSLPTIAAIAGCSSVGSNTTPTPTLYRPRSGENCPEDIDVSHPNEAQATDAWPQPHYDAKFTGFAPNAGPDGLSSGWRLTNADISEWTGEAGGLYTTPTPLTIADSEVITVGKSGIHAVAADDGTHRWTLETQTVNNWPVFSTPSHHIVIGPADEGGIAGQINIFDRESRSLVRTVSTNLVHWPVVANENLYTPTDEGVRILAPSSGEFLTPPYTGPKGVLPKYTPVVENTIIGVNEESVYAIDMETGEIAWTTQVGTTPDRGIIELGKPVATPDGVIIASNYAPTQNLLRGGLRDRPTTFSSLPEGHTVLHSLDPTSGERRWSYPVGGTLLLPRPAYADGTVIVGGLIDARLTESDTSSGFVAAIDAQAGCRQWWTPLEESQTHPWPSFAIADDHIYFTTRTQWKGRATPVLYALQASDGTIAARNELGDVRANLPVVAGGSVYVYIVEDGSKPQIRQFGKQ